MFSALIVGSVLLALNPADPGSSPTADDLKVYQAEALKAGRDADAHVRLALWCESRGLKAERMSQLALAVLNNPAHAAARGLMGLVAYRGRWQRPDAVTEQVKSDAALAAALAEYNTRRARIKSNADAHWQLALWCEEQGLKPEAIAHLTTVVRLDPARESAWKRLGYKKHDGRWTTDAQLAAETVEADARKQANRHWKPLLEKWRGWLGDKSNSKRVAAEKALADVTDPRAVASVWSVFATGGKGLQARAVQLFGQIDVRDSSRALAIMAVYSDDAEVRRAATETLKGRDPREFADRLIRLLRDPIKYEVRPVGGPGSPGALFVQGKRFNVQRLYAPPGVTNVGLMPGDRIWYDDAGMPNIERTLWSSKIDEVLARVPAAEAVAIAQSSLMGPVFPDALVNRFPAFGTANRQVAASNQPQFLAVQSSIRQQLSMSNDNRLNIHRVTVPEVREEIPIGQMVLEAQRAAVLAQRQLESDLAALETWNQIARDGNERIAQALNAVSGEELPVDPKAWRSWWINQLGYRSSPDEQTTQVPTVIEDVPLDYAPQSTPWVMSAIGISYYFRALSCFGAGTLVRTLSGPRPIETLQVGDRVLTQDIMTGALAYQPILVVHHNPPSPTFLVKVAGETIVSSPFHRFWVAGKGWVMARDLRGGETLRMLGGLAKVDEVESGRVQPVFNLDIADNHDFFAGASGALVHDNTLPDLRLKPFDAEPSLASATPRAR